MAVLVIAAVAAFYGGMRFDQYQAQNQKGAQFGQNGARNFQGGAGLRGQGGRGGAGATVGEVIKKDANSITVQLPNNEGTKLILLPNSATVVKSVEASSTSIAIGKFVVVNGKANTDGSVTAQSVQLRDNLPMLGRPDVNGSGTPSAATSGSPVK